jgi:hypothetical protein
MTIKSLIRRRLKTYRNLKRSGHGAKARKLLRQIEVLAELAA